MTFKYTDEQLENIRQLRKAGHTFKVIAQITGNSPGGISSVFRRMRENGTAPSNPRVIRNVVLNRTDVPDCVLEERERRHHEEKSLIGHLMGDPVFSQSALSMARLNKPIEPVKA
jgi:hypothetical protein